MIAMIVNIAAWIAAAGFATWLVFDFLKTEHQQKAEKQRN